MEVESRLRGLQLRVWGGGGVCMKKSIVKREERLCVSKGGGGVYEKINSEVEKERLYVSTKRGGGEKEVEYLGGSYTKVFCVMEPEPKINNFGSAILVFF